MALWSWRESGECGRESWLVSGLRVGKERKVDELD